MQLSDRLNSIIDKLVHSTSEDTTLEAYKEWANSYDIDLDIFGYVAPQTGAALFHEALANPAARVFDAGCGTGLVAQNLHKMGYTNIDGADFSADMLDKAAELNIYTSLQQLNFRNRLPMDDNHYAGSICIGVYSSTIGDLFLAELIRVTAPNGVITMTCRPVHYDDDLRLQIDQHAAAGRIDIISREVRPYITGQDAEAAFIVMRVR